MKKFMIAFAIIGSIILGSSFKASAATTDYYCLMSITDTCNGGGYHGYYDVIVEVYYNGSLVCTGTGTTLGGQHCVHLTCDLPPQNPDCKYKLILTKVTRSNDTCGITTNAPSNSNLCWSYIASCNINTPQFYITL
jgi:hypothetical protein